MGRGFSDEVRPLLGHRPGATSDDTTRGEHAEVRLNEAHQREAAADQREFNIDARERVLERWEQEIGARAAELHMLGTEDEEFRQRAQRRRELDRTQRRTDAESRRNDALEREIRRTGRESAAGPSPDAAPHARSTDGLSRLVVAVSADPPLDEVTILILAAAVDTVPGCTGASIALSVTGQLQTAASTAPWAAELDAAQLERHGGPLPAASKGDALVTADLMTDQRWPQLSDLSSSSAARGAMSFGLVVNGTTTGVLTLYAALGASFTAHDVSIGDMLAAHATVTLGRTMERMMFEAQSEAWQRALASRDAIGQAKGILMQQRSLSADEAFQLLRETSQLLNIKLRSVAEHVVDQRRLPDT
jgi:hypothetical protein